MAKANPNARLRKYERILTISTSSHEPHHREAEQSLEFSLDECGGSHRIVPYIRLKGRWLERAGFHRRYQVRVAVSRGRPVIINK